MLPLLMLLAKGNSLLANIHDKNNLSPTTNTLKKADVSVAIVRPSSEQCTIKNTGVTTTSSR